MSSLRTRRSEPAAGATHKAPAAHLTDPRVLLALVVVVALVLRLVDAGSRLSHDDGYSWLVAGAGSPSAFLRVLARYENTPPLFYLLMAPLPLDSAVWLRLPSIVAGTLMIPVLYALVRDLLGVRAALLAALGLAVAPFAVSFSDYARGFMVCGLGLLVALLAAERLARGAPRRWWWVYGLAAVWSLYSEYYAGLYLLVIVAGLLVRGRPRRRQSLVLGLLPFASLLPWIPQIERSQNYLGITKLPWVATAPTPGHLRDALVPLFFGEHGSGSGAVRTVQVLLILAGLIWGCAMVARRGSREAAWLLPGVLAGALVLHVVISAFETDIFLQRYLTTIIPLAAAIVAGGVALVRRRWAVPLVAAVLLAGGVAVAVHRAGRQYEPDSPLAVRIAARHGYRTILTNSAVVAFYGRRLHVILDRPFGIGAGVERSCAPRCAVIDDARYGGVRAGPGPRTSVGPIVIRFPPAE